MLYRDIENLDDVVFDVVEEIVVVPNRKKIVVSLKRDAKSNEIVGIDVRWYKLYAKGGRYDGKIKPTSKGICFEIGLLESVLKVLTSIYRKAYGLDFRG